MLYATWINDGGMYSIHAETLSEIEIELISRLGSLPPSLIVTFGIKNNRVES